MAKAMSYADYMDDFDQFQGKGQKSSNGHTYSVPKWHYSYTGHEEAAVQWGYAPSKGCGEHPPAPPKHQMPVSPAKEQAVPSKKPAPAKHPTPSKPKECAAPTGPKAPPCKEQQHYTGGTTPTKPQAPKQDCLPGMNIMDLTLASPAYFCMHASPLVEYGCTHSVELGLRNAMLEAVLLGILVGMGFAHEHAYIIIDRWRKAKKICK